LEKSEVDKAQAGTGKLPKEFMVGYDALAVYVHKDNPLKEISLEQLMELFGEGGKMTKWSQLNTTVPKCSSDQIILVSRQNNSGTYHYFREVVVGKKSDMKAASLDMHGSKDVVETVARTPSAIGYSGLGYATPQVKILKVGKKKGGPYVQPAIASTLDGSYPIARPMFMYTPGQPTTPVQKFLDWVMSGEGQKIVEQTGYVPLPKKVASAN